MIIIDKKLNEIKPYGRNPRINDAAVPAVMESIKQFGFRVPIVIDNDGVIVAGHTRYKAEKELKLKTVPCVTTEDLTPEQVRAFRVADNKTAELAEWDFDLLKDEISDMEDFDFADFGFEMTDEEEEHDRNRIENRERNISIMNLEKATYNGCGKYDIPEILPTYELPSIREWIGFNYVLSDEDPEGKAVHFFLDDYQFARIWNNPDEYIEKLSRYVCVASPDFSPYSDMPLAMQIFNHYRKHWVGRYLQDNGITVIPTIRASADERSLEWFLDGEPHEGIVLISSMWMGGERNPYFDRCFKMMNDTLNPAKILCYGNEIEGLDGVEYIESFAEKRYRSKNSNV